MYYRNNNTNPFILSFIAIAIIIVVLFIDNIISSTQYNDGICPCGGTFQYKQAIGYRYETRYLYICDKCGRTIKILQYHPPK